MSIRRTLAWNAAGVLAVVVVATLAAALWWTPRSGSRAAEVVGFLTTLAPTLLLVGLLGLVGTAVFIWLPGRVFSGTGVGLIMGIGAATTAIVLALTYSLFGSVTVGILPLLIAAAAALLIAVIREGRRAGGVRQALGRIGRAARSLTLDSGDVVIAALVGALGFTVARLGLTSWTNTTNDFHRYAGSAIVWLSNSGYGPDFAARHLDAYGSGMAERASGEKPGVTALLSFATVVTGLQPFQLLTPLSFILLLLTISALALTARTMFGLTARASVIAVGASSLSMVPLTRLFEAQPGHLATVAFIAIGLACGAQFAGQRRWGGLLSWGAVTALALAAALASNFTLAVGAVPLVGTLLVWQWLQAHVRVIDMVARAGALAGAVVITSLPLAAGYLGSFRGQSSGAAGSNVPFPSPLALIGQQLDLSSVPGTTQVWIGWGVLGLTVVLLAVTVVRWSVDSVMVVAVLAASTAVTIAFSLGYGPENYVVHKWLAVFISIAMPIVIAATVSHLGRRAVRPVLAGLGVLSASALLIASYSGYGVRHVVPVQLAALADDDRLAQVETLNVNLNDYYLDSMGGMVPPSRQVRVVARTYSDASAPVGNVFLINSADPGYRDWTDVEPINDYFATANLDLSIGTEPVRFGSEYPSGRNYRFGVWFDPEPAGAWTRPGLAMVAFDPDASLGTGDLEVTITGTHYADASQPRTVSFSVNGEVVDEVTSTDATEREYRLVVPRSSIVANDGRVVIGITSSEGLSPQTIGGSDGRKLVFLLTSLQVKAK